MVETLDLVAKPAAAVDVVQLEEDLLSSNDKALQPKQNGNGGRGGQQQHQPRSRFTTKGKLSIGSDDISRVMIVSCEGESLMEIGMHDNTVATRVGDNFHFNPLRRDRFRCAGRRSTLSGSLHLLNHRLLHLLHA